MPRIILILACLLLACGTKPEVQEVRKKSILLCEICGKKMSPTNLMSETLVAYFSPPGHNHDDNCLNREYVCPNGHSTVVSLRRRCPVCDWVGKEECFCHPNEKVDKWPE